MGSLVRAAGGVSIGSSAGRLRGRAAWAVSAVAIGGSEWYAQVRKSAVSGWQRPKLPCGCVDRIALNFFFFLRGREVGLLIYMRESVV